MNRAELEEYYERLVADMTRAGILRRTETGSDMPKAERYQEVALTTHAGAPNLGEQMSGDNPDVIGPLLWGSPK